MYPAKIVALAANEPLSDHPRPPYTGALLSAVPVAAPRLAHARRREIPPGDVPSPTNPPSACRFHPRCPKAQQICSEVEPRLESKGNTIAACHFPLTREEASELVATTSA